MPRLSAGRLPKYRHHRASNRAFVEIYGRRIYLGRWQSQASRIEYDRLIGEWLQQGRPNYLPAEKPIPTVTELCLAYWHHAQDYYRGREKTLDHVRRSIRRLRRLYGSIPADEFGAVALKAHRTKLLEEHDLSRKYVNEHIRRVKQIFRWAASEELIPEEIYRRLATVEGLRKNFSAAREARPVKPVEDEVVDATLPHLPETVADMVRLQRLTGCRPAEVCGIRPCDVDRSESIWVYRPSKHKTENHGIDRIILIGPKAQQVLQRYLLRGAEDYCFDPRESEAKRLTERQARRKTPLSCGNRPGTVKKKRPKRMAGQRYTTDSYRRAIRRACDRAKVRRWAPNQLRHAAATEVRRRYGLEAAQVTLGHARLATTQVYAQRDLRLAARVAAELG